MSFLAKCFTIVAVFAAILFIVAKTIKIYLLRKKYSHLPGPPAKGILGFYLGNLKQVVHTVNNNKILCDLMIEWVKEYGSVFKFQILDKIVVFTIDPLGVKETYITENFPKIPEVYENVGYPYNERFLGTGLITDTDTSRWKHRRSLFNPGFHRQCLKSFLNEINSKGDILLERLRTLADGKTVVKLFDEVNHAALDIIASIAFGMNVDSINDPSNELNKNVYESLKGFYRTTFDPFIYYKPTEWGFILNYRRVLRKLRELGNKQILKRLELVKDGSYISNDILTNLLKSHENEKFDIDDMIDDFLTFFVAGQETTANTLAFSFLEIGKNPEVLQKIREELNEVLGSRTEVTNEDLTRLHYTGLVYKETLRLWPPIPEIARMANKDLSINNYYIPKGSWIEVSTYVSGRQEEHFDEPYKFKPERFEKPLKNYTYFPFSLGPRNCIGQNFAQMVGKVFIAKVIKNFDIILDSAQNFGYVQEATLRPASGTRCFLLPRTN